MQNEELIVRVKDGRTLHVFTAGEPDGMPILIHHGTPGSGLLYGPWVDEAEVRGLRLISYDRPGYGASAPQRRRTVASCAEDVRAIATTLGLNRMGVWGVSGGGPHALACAALLPELVAAAASLGSPAPYSAPGLSFLDGMGEDNLMEFGAALEGTDRLEEFIDGAVGEILSSSPRELVEMWQSLLSRVDADVVGEEFAGFLFASMRAGIEPQRAGWIDDDIAFISPWGFDTSDIRIPVMILHGEHDQFVPFSHGEWLARSIPGAEPRLSADDGHLSLYVNRITEVNLWLMEKMQSGS